MRAFAPALMLALTVLAGRADVHAQPAARDDVRALLLEIEQVILSGQQSRYMVLVSDSADRDRARAFTDLELRQGVTRAVIQERDVEPLGGPAADNGYRVLVDGFIELGDRARVATWRFDLKRAGAGGPLRIADQEQITSVEGLYRLSLDPTKQFDARNLTIRAEDLDLSLPQGSVFVADIDQGIMGHGTTALVLLGHGQMHFHPKPETEKGQVKIFCGKETLETTFDAAFIRVNPADVNALMAPGRLTSRPIDAGAWRRANAVFRQESVQSFGLDLADLSRESWSLLPSAGDFLAEVRTRRFGTLTYARSAAEPEDITLFDRKHRRNISIYASEEKLARHGRFYNEDDLTDYQILDYNIDLEVVPDRVWLEGRARLRLKVRSYALGSVTLRLADALVVQSIVSDRFGRLFGVRVRNQNSIVVNLPAVLPHDEELTLTIAYSGRLQPQTSDQEMLAQQARGNPDEVALIPPEPSILYSNRSYWYPQGNVTGYATATMRLTLPAAFDCVASGDLAIGSPVLIAAADRAPARKIYIFRATQPVRYLAFVVSRFIRSDTVTIALPRDRAAAGDGLSGVSYESLNLSVETNPRQVQRGHEYAARATDIVQFYSSLTGDCPYPSFTLALVESERPGGHSPAYFASLNQPLPSTPFVWRNDPESFSNYPEFYLAHELAHQWWGQAVGWRNYHEQWLSEGFAQYFAALYAQHQRGPDVFAGVLRQLRKWGTDESAQGPVYLGYRLGHIRGEPRVFSALVYNKSAAVLHMLRCLVGDEVFFRGVRRFYRTSRFQKAGTEEFRAAMEAEAKRPLERFFERWIYGSALPQLKVTYRIEAGDVVLHVEQLGELFDVPLTITLQYADTKSVDVQMAISDRSTDHRVPLTGTLRGIDIGKNDGTMANISR